MIRDIRHTGIVVEDLEESLYFYCDLLGFRIFKKLEESGSYIDSISLLDKVNVTTVKLEVPNGQLIELLKFHSHPRIKKSREICEIGITHISLTVDNIDTEYERLKRGGIVFHSSPRRSPDGYAKVTFCRAPEGTYIELVEVL